MPTQYDSQPISMASMFLLLLLFVIYRRRICADWSECVIITFKNIYFIINEFVSMNVFSFLFIFHVCCVDWCCEVVWSWRLEIDLNIHLDQHFTGIPDLTDCLRTPAAPLRHTHTHKFMSNGKRLSVQNQEAILILVFSFYTAASRALYCKICCTLLPLWTYFYCSYSVRFLLLVSPLPSTFVSTVSLLSPIGIDRLLSAACHCRSFANQYNYYHLYNIYYRYIRSSRGSHSSTSISVVQISFFTHVCAYARQYNVERRFVSVSTRISFHFMWNTRSRSKHFSHVRKSVCVWWYETI